MTTGKLHSIETFGAVDGPGIRTIFFLQGCPARCLYCHNPDTWSCEAGREIALEEVLQTAKRSLPYYGKNGGVTFSGGEPLMQEEFVLEAIRMLKRHGIGTVIDTSGTWVDEYTEDIIAECELLLLDVKHSDRRKFEEICGCSQKNLHLVMSLANKYRTPIWVRQVIVPGINDTEDNVDALTSFIKSHIENLYHAELLGYHTMALDKYKKMGLAYRLDGVPPMETGRLRLLNDRLQNALALAVARTAS